jgi:hypothetical protein
MSAFHIATLRNPSERLAVRSAFGEAVANARNESTLRALYELARDCGEAIACGHYIEVRRNDAPHFERVAHEISGDLPF